MNETGAPRQFNETLFLSDALEVLHDNGTYFHEPNYRNVSNMTFLSTVGQKKTYGENIGIPGTIPPLQTDNNHIVIPLMSFVFGFPVLVMTILCIIQERNKWMYERQAAIRLQNARLSTTSTLYAGFHPPKSSIIHHKDPSNIIGVDDAANTSNNNTTFANGFFNKQKNFRYPYCNDRVHIRLKDLKMKSSDDTLEEIDELETEQTKIISTNNEKTSCIIDI